MPCISICICISLGCVSPGTLPGRDGDPDPERDEHDRKHARERLAAGQHLLDEDRDRDQGHPDQAHDAEREQREHQAEAAADADAAVLDPHPERAERCPGARAGGSAAASGSGAGRPS